MESKKQNHSGVLWFLVVIISFFGPVWFFYGSISPCEILKKEISRSVSDIGGDAPMGYMILGGFVERRIDMLSPSECVVGIYQIKTKGLEKGIDNLMSTSNLAPSQQSVKATEEDFNVKPQEYEATFSQETQGTSSLNITEYEAATYQQLLEQSRKTADRIRQELR